MRQGCEGGSGERILSSEKDTHEQWKKHGFLPLRLEPKEEMKVKRADK